MAKPWNRKKRPKPIKGACSYTLKKDLQCPVRKVQKMTCITCEELAAAGKLRVDEIFTLEGCAEHFEAVRDQMKRHTMLAHPLNIARATIAALKGDL